METFWCLLGLALGFAALSKFGTPWQWRLAAALAWPVGAVALGVAAWNGAGWYSGFAPVGFALSFVAGLVVAALGRAEAWVKGWFERRKAERVQGQP
jgi:hypothetical protein